MSNFHAVEEYYSYDLFHSFFDAAKNRIVDNEKFVPFTASTSPRCTK